MAPDYDVTLQEAPMTPEDKQETAEFISGIGDKYMQLQDKMSAGALYVQAINMLPLDGDVKQNLASVLTPNQQMIPAAQAQQAIQALQQKLQQAMGMLPQAQAAKLQSEATLNQARVGEVQATVHEKIAGSVKDFEMAQQTAIENKLIGKHGEQIRVNA